MKKLNITKGEWELEINSDTQFVVGTTKWGVCFIPRYYELAKDNAALIVDAGNTYQKCEVLPSELLKQRNELLAALKTLLQEARGNSAKVTGSLLDTQAEEAAYNLILALS